MRQVPDNPVARQNFVPDDPTEDPDFNPSNWTGTILSGVIRTQYEEMRNCTVCGYEMTATASTQDELDEQFRGWRGYFCPAHAYLNHR